MDNENTDNKPPAQAAAPVAPSDPVAESSAAVDARFTQADMDRVAALARDQGRRSALKAAPVVAPAATAPTPTAQAASVEQDPVTLQIRQLQEQLNEQRLRSTFDKMAIRSGVPEELADDFFDMMKMQAPADPREWLADKCSKFKLGATTGQSAAQPTASTATATEHKASTTAPVPVPHAANISDKGPAASSNARDYEGIFETDPLRSTPDDFSRLAVKMGREKALQFVSDRVNAYLRTVKLVPDNRRQR